MMMASTGAMAAPSAPTQKSAFVQGTSAAGDVLNGVFTITNFVNQGGQLVANGVLNGTLTSAAGHAGVELGGNIAGVERFRELPDPESSAGSSRPECFGSDRSLEPSGAKHHGCSGGW
jgi:hypothetical protein